MFRRSIQRHYPPTPRYYIYLSETKVEMLYPQIPRHLLGSLEAEVKANVGILQATVRGGKQTENQDLYTHTAIVVNYLRKHDQVGTVNQPERYIEDVAAVKYGIVREYASDIAFFGGRVGPTRVGLIGSSDSMVGITKASASRHHLFYYTLVFLNSIAEEAAADPVERPPYYSYSEAFKIASKSTASLETTVKFFARLLHEERGLIIATPIYVALAD